MIIITQQGSGSRILSAYLHGEVTPEPFAVKPLPKPDIQLPINFRLMYRHLEQLPELYDRLKDEEVIHLYRDPAHTFFRDVAKYDQTFTKQDFKNHVDYVKFMRETVNNNFNNVRIMHYEDFIKDIFRGEIKEFTHL